MCPCAQVSLVLNCLSALSARVPFEYPPRALRVLKGTDIDINIEQKISLLSYHLPFKKIIIKF